MVLQTGKIILIFPLELSDDGVSSLYDVSIFLGGIILQDFFLLQQNLEPGQNRRSSTLVGPVEYTHYIAKNTSYLYTCVDRRQLSNLVFTLLVV